MSEVLFFCEDPEIQQLTRKHADDAGFDLRCKNAFELHGATGEIEVPTGLHVAIPMGWYGKCEARSGLAFKYGIMVKAGVIDAGYRGEIVLKIAWNIDMSVHHQEELPVRFEKGDRIAQLIILPCWPMDPVKVDSLEALGTTQRGSGGFGSTGIS